MSAGETLQTCSSCGASNDVGEEVCFKCGQGLSRLTEGSLLGGRYEIRSRLGRGGMGIVYKARDRELDDEVAVKVLRADMASPDLIRRFRSEIKLARRVTHKNVCRIHEFGREGALDYIVMEYVQGVDFKRVLRERGPLPADEAYDVTVQIADGLQAIHEAGIVHRDLKTPNIMRDLRGVVKLMDFGIAKSLEGATQATAAGQVIGTPEYMSPEQARGETVDARSDLYALGIVVYELFVGDVPFRGETPIATLFRHIQTPPPLVNVRLPTALAGVLGRALAKSPAERFKDAHAFAEALRAARHQRTATLATPTVAVPVVGAAVRKLEVAEPVATPRPMATAVPAPTAVIDDARAPVRSRPSAGGAGRGLWIAAGVAGAVAAAGVGYVSRTRAVETVPAAASTAGVAVPAPIPVSTTLEAAPRAPDTTPTSYPLAVPLATLAARPSSAAATPAAKVPARVPVAPPTPGRTLATAAAVPSPEVVAATAPPAVVRAPPAEGMLQIIVIPWADVEVDGAKIGVSPPLKPLALAEGVHTVVLSHPEFQPFRRKVTISRGQTTRLQVDLAREAFPR